MRRWALLSVVVIAVATGLCGGDALAQSQVVQSRGPIVATSMAVRPDAVLLQAMIVEWLRATVTSTQFIIGTVIGVIAAESGRFALRWLMHALAFLNGTFQFVMRYRLMVASVLAAISYAVTHWIIA